MILNLKKRNSSKRLAVLISFLTLLVSFKSSNQWSDFPIGNELFWWIMQAIFFIILFKLKGIYTSPQIEKNQVLVKLYLFWNIICIIRGAFVAENYWEWKNLIATAFFLLLPLLVYVANSLRNLQILVKTWFKYGLFIFIPFSPFIWGDGVGKFLIPFSFLLLFFPILNLKWKIIVLLVTVFVITFDITARSNVIKFLMPLLIGHLFYIRKLLSVKIQNIFRLLLLSLPFILLFLAVSNIFNVFKIDEYLGNYEVKSGQHGLDAENLTGDTRTFLYVEVIRSALKNNYVLLGRTPARGNDSAYFGDYNKEVLQTGKAERFANEVSILNIFTWLGFVGVIIYYLIFIRATYLAINQSNNIFIKLIGLNVSFRWAYGWVEDFSEFDLSNIFLWIMIGMCFSPFFRKLTNKQMKNWVHSIFEKRKPLKRPLQTLNNHQSIYRF